MNPRNSNPKYKDLKKFPNNTRLEQFFNLAYERHRIYVLKELGCPKPWTKDDIFKNYFFCNVFRKIDKTSKFIIENVIQPNEDNPLLWKAIILCRLLSRIETIQYLLDNDSMFDFPKAYKLLRKRKASGGKVFTNAFIINSRGFKGNEDKINYCFMLLNQMSRWRSLHSDGLDDVFKDHKTIEYNYNRLREFNGVGDFMGYEYVTDLTYSDRYLKNAPDKYTWMTYGLGAVRGMNRLLYGKPVSNKIAQPELTAQYVFDNWKAFIEDTIEFEISNTIKQGMKFYVPGGYKDIHFNTIRWYEPFSYLTMREVEHWLCEYDKYCRGGSAKRRYIGYVN